ncbi:hypothetical protein [Paracoccus fistulariae]|uniref:Elements of external origin n=1 Tax=Paracoccus fistulariae TaxID=658446 RepID=A0ABY7SP36_9RHOB|nr:hypothetical protein [Paracoccus fistulariae]MDB6183089.1 hypothetical protein [Paracoccus fistulariae]WCR08790.1 hypothetical protein JHX87_08365 [Paracoccus fistulariae]
MKGMSERAYAAHAGLSRGAIQKARRSGRLVLFEDGSIDAAASDSRRAATTDPDQQNRSNGGTARQAAASERPTRPADSLAAPSISGPGDSSSYLKARTALTVYQAQERQIAIQKKKGVLVDRARAETLVFRLARQERDAWVTWPARVAAIMAAELSAEMEKTTGEAASIGTGVLQRVLETHVRDQLAALADLKVSLE